MTTEACEVEVLPADAPPREGRRRLTRGERAAGLIGLAIVVGVLNHLATPVPVAPVVPARQVPPGWPPTVVRGQLAALKRRGYVNAVNEPGRGTLWERTRGL